MRQIFISHVEEDASIALAVARGLEDAGYTTWYYEAHSNPGPSYLIQIDEALQSCEAMVLVISLKSLQSWQVEKEVERAHESGKPIIPLLKGIQHEELQKRPLWRMAVGTATSIRVPPEGVAVLVPRIVKGLRTLGSQPLRESATKLTGTEKRAVGQASPPVARATKLVLEPQWEQPPPTPLGRRSVLGWRAIALGLVLCLSLVAGTILYLHFFSNPRRGTDGAENNKAAENGQSGAKSPAPDEPPRHLPHHALAQDGKGAKSPAPDEPPRPLGDGTSPFSEDFTGTRTGKLPRGWTGNNLILVQKGDGRTQLELGETGTYSVTLPRQAIKGDFFLECEYNLLGRSDQQLEIDFKHAAGSQPLRLSVDGDCNLALNTSKKRGNFPYGRTKPFSLYVEREGKVYRVRLNEEELLAQPLDYSGKFEVITLVLTKSANRPPPRIYSIRIGPLLADDGK